MAVILSYVVSAALYIPSFWFGFRTMEMPLKLNDTDTVSLDSNYIYLPKDGFWHIYSFFCVFVMRIGPLIAIFIMNMIMIHKLNILKIRRRYTRNQGLFSVSRVVSDSEGGSNGTKNTIKKLSREIKVKKVLVLISTSYLFFTLPHTIDLTIYMLECQFCKGTCSLQTDPS